jgi:hypothetical protein
MRQIISSQKTKVGIWNLLLGHSLVTIILYAAYRIGAFIAGQITLPPNIESAGFLVSVITITMFGTGWLLRFDMKHLRRDFVRIDREFHSLE